MEFKAECVTEDGSFLRAACRAGYARFVVQAGNGSFISAHISPDDALRLAEEIRKHYGVKDEAPPVKPETASALSGDRRRITPSDPYAPVLIRNLHRAASDIAAGFSWDGTSEGWEFWSNVVSRINDIANRLKAASEPKPNPADYKSPVPEGYDTIVHWLAVNKPETLQHKDKFPAIGLLQRTLLAEAPQPFTLYTIYPESKQRISRKHGMPRAFPAAQLDSFMRNIGIPYRPYAGAAREAA